MEVPMANKKQILYFIGVTTGQSSIMKLFPLWAEELGLPHAAIKGIDLPIHAPAERYRDVVRMIKEDKTAAGALVTTHKIDLYQAAQDLFDYLDPYAHLFGELSCLSKRDGIFCGHAKDPITAGFAMQSFIPPGYWADTHAEVLILGAGGSALAIAACLSDEKNKENIPRRIHITNRSSGRLAEAVKKLSYSRVPMSFYLSPVPMQNDQVVKMMPPHSLIVNATGLGKDRPGSPLSDQAEFPDHALIWELNYRGTLEFMHQAEKQQEQKHLHIEDGFTYFIHGWAQVIAEVFHLEIDTDRFQRLSQIASAMRG